MILATARLGRCLRLCRVASFWLTHGFRGSLSVDFGDLLGCQLTFDRTAL
jgi:hypothetical protein